MYRVRRGTALIAAILFVFMCPVVGAEENAPITGAELQQAMYDLVVIIEKAGKLDTTASEVLYWNSPDIEAAFEAIPDKERFLEAIDAIKKRSQAARSAGKAVKVEVSGPISTSHLNGTAPFLPNYPNASMDVDYAVLYPLGLVTSSSSRCDGAGYAEYQAVLAGANITLTVSQLACDAAGCDPTGIGCIIVCGATKGLELIYRAAAVPVVACQSWEAKLDAAENQAAYENSASILDDLDAHDDRILSALTSQASAADDLAAALAAHNLLVNAALDTVEANLAAHDVKLGQHNGNLMAHDVNLGQHDTRLNQHDIDLKSMLAQMLATIAGNQEEIIKLLNTPEGKRPGWNKEGY